MRSMQAIAAQIFRFAQDDNKGMEISRRCWCFSEAPTTTEPYGILVKNNRMGTIDNGEWNAKNASDDMRSMRALAAQIFRFAQDDKEGIFRHWHLSEAHQRLYLQYLSKSACALAPFCKGG